MFLSRFFGNLPQVSCVLIGFILMIPGLGHAQMSGSYTIDAGASATSTNFISFQSAADSLHTLGVSGSVTIDVVAGSGPYNETVSFDSIPGASSTNTITIDGHYDTLTFAGDATNYATLSLSKTKYVTFQRLAIFNTGTAFAIGAHLALRSEYITFDSCWIEITEETQTSWPYPACVRFSDDPTTQNGTQNNGSNLTIKNSQIHGGEQGISAYGPWSLNAPVGFTFENNVIKNFKAKGITLERVDDITISGNDISRPDREEVDELFGIDIRSNNNVFTRAQIFNNHLHSMYSDVANNNPSSDLGGYVMFLSRLNAPSTQRNGVYNNIIDNITNKSDDIYGIYLANGDYLDLVHNTIILDDTTNVSGKSIGLRSVWQATDLHVENNLFYINRGGVGSNIGLEYQLTSSSVQSDYNAVYVSNTGNGYGYIANSSFDNYHVTLADWQAGSNNDDHSSDAFPSIYYNGAGLPVASNVAIDGLGTSLTFTTDYTGATRGSSPDPGAVEFTAPSLDIGVALITGPAAPADTGDLDVEVRIVNYGSTTLTSADVYTSIENGGQIDTLGPFAFSGSLAGGDTSAVLTLGTYNFDETLHFLKAWTTAPNASTDSIADNDTITLQFCSFLPGGSYTINDGAPASSTNFQSFNEAADRLNWGIGGSVTIDVVAGSGPYNEQVMFTNIPKINAADSIVLNGNGTTITHTATVSRKYIVGLNKVSHFVLDSLNVIRDNDSMAIGVLIVHEADYTTIRKCSIDVSFVNAGYPFGTIAGVAIMGSSSNLFAPTNSQYIKIIGNTIVGGDYGIFAQGNDAPQRLTGYEFRDNAIVDFEEYGITLSDVDSLVVMNNEISRPNMTNSNGTMRFISVRDAKWSVIANNRIHTAFASTPSWGSVSGIYMSSSDASSAAQGNEVYNNLIYNLNSTSNVVGIEAWYDRYTNYYNNTVVLNTGSPSASSVYNYGFRFFSSPWQVNVANNVIYLDPVGLGKFEGFNFSSTPSVSAVTCDYNSVFIDNTTPSSSAYGSLSNTQFVDLAAWQTANSGIYGQNSAEEDPLFTNLATYDFLPTSPYLDNQGTNVGITTDFFDSVRNNPPDPGAIEFTTPPLVVDTLSTQNISCNGLSDGSISVEALDGASPYTYLWSNGDTTTAVSNLVAGTYTVTVTDAVSSTVTLSVTLTEPTAMTASTTVISNIDCFGDTTGSASVTAGGGVGPYTYLWTSGETTATASNLTAGVQTVTVTGADGCTITASDSITQPAAPLAGVITIDSNVSCFGETDGGLTIVASDGTAGYTYEWSTTVTTASITGLGAGAYTVTITDANSCTLVTSETVTEPGEITLTTAVLDSISCFGVADGSISTSITGGTAAFTYAWSNATTASTATALVAGTYSVTVTDANGCTDSTSQTITEPTVFTSSIVVDSNVLCFSESTGGATVSGAGGTLPYTYNWSNGVTTASATGIPAGTYSVTLTDGNGCTSTESATITEPTQLLGSVAVDSNANCFGESNGGVSIGPTGGVTPYTYDWSNTVTTAINADVPAGTYTVTVTDANGCTIAETGTVTEPTLLVATGSIVDPISCFGVADGKIAVAAAGGTGPGYTYNWSTSVTTDTVSALGPGTYTVTITDNNGCTDTTSIVLTEPTALSVTTTVDSNASCFGFANGGATAAATGGTTPYAYSWSNTISTAANQSITAGTYTVTVTDANGCTANELAVITEPALLTASVSIVANVNCFGESTGSAIASGAGGITPYTFDWSGGATTALTSNVAAGVQTVTITDANGCVATASDTITQPATAVSGVITIDSNVTCFGGTNGGLTVIASGGIPGYAYSWSNGVSFSTTTGLSTGTYTVTITDANSCTAVVSEAITSPADLVISSTIASSIDCFGASNGAITTSVTGGTSPYAYNWSNGSSSAAIATLASATYTVTVTDANGCTDTNSVLLTEPALLVASVVLDSNVACFGESTGGATATETGGTSPFAYSWSNGATLAANTSLVQGTYTVTITDANGCTDQDQITITEPTLLTSSVSNIVDVLCFGDSTGGATAAGAGGTVPYTYSWSNGGNSAAETTLTAASHTVTVTDANGCTDTSSLTIQQPTELLASISATADASCNGFADGSASATAAGGVSPYTFAWTTGGTAATETNMPAGAFTVTVTDANNCFVSVDSTLTEPDSLIVQTGMISDPLCNGDLNGSASVTVNGGTLPYAYNWTSGSTTDSDSLLGAGLYQVVVTDSNGCVDSVDIILNEPDSLLVSLSVVDVTCAGETDGEITATVAGGTAPYSAIWDDPQAQTTLVASGLADGTYTVTVDDANGCTASESATVSTQFANPVVDLGADSIMGCKDTTIILDAGSGSAYLWSTGETTQTIEVTETSTISVTVTDANGCNGSDTIEVELVGPCTGIQELFHGASIQFYPNPTDGLINLELDGFHEKSLTLEVLNAQGQVIRREQQKNNSGYLYHQFDLGKEAQGVYFIRLTTDSQTYTDRISVF